ncbi:hypothetical protein BLOT_015893 [Blomia tropicalis]|nr:hypothetical protein BLOT_015893 [Blomia tropicalis]
MSLVPTMLNFQTKPFPTLLQLIELHLNSFYELLLEWPLFNSLLFHGFPLRSTYLKHQNPIQNTLHILWIAIANLTPLYGLLFSDLFNRQYFYNKRMPLISHTIFSHANYYWTI